MARRYRPQTFDALIGQEFLVRVLTNAFTRDQVPHAMLLTGVRGVGKTTTARIIAKGLNCLEADGPTVTPCGVCANCRAIAESRHVDVLEMDAASRTGIDDIREIIEGVAYRAAEARYKVYIIDETHMLSRNAFNGLLKTLEEPPSHVVFILATTDVEKVPVTVLSRCMRFDLRRVDPSTMIAHLQSICAQERVAAAPEALALIARASEGSVRDALSLLDQAVAHAGADGLDEAATRDMLGLADRSGVVRLFEQIMSGDASGALDGVAAMHAAGADPAALLKDLGAFCHLATLARVAPTRLQAPELTEAERAAATAAGERFGAPALGRLWQMILQALEEVARAPAALAAVEMAVIRMTHVAELPPPAEILRRLSAEQAPVEGGRAGPPAPGDSAPGAAMVGAPPPAAPAMGAAAEPGPTPPKMSGRSAAAALAAPLSAEPSAAPPARAEPVRSEVEAPAARSQAVRPEPVQAQPAGAAAPPQQSAPADPSASPQTFDAIIGLIRKKRDAKLLVDVERWVRPGPVRPGAFEFTPVAGAPDELASEIGKKLGAWTGRRWIVSVSGGHGAPTIAETRSSQETALRQTAEDHPIVQAAKKAFPGLELVEVVAAGARAAPASAARGDDEFFERVEPSAVDRVPDDAALQDLVYDDGFDAGGDPEDPGADDDALGAWEPDYAPR